MTRQQTFLVIPMFSQHYINHEAQKVDPKKFNQFALDWIKAGSDQPFEPKNELGHLTIRFSPYDCDRELNILEKFRTSGIQLNPGANRTLVQLQQLLETTKENPY